MAQLFTEVKRSVVGDMWVILYDFDANGTASGYLETGLDTVYSTANSNSDNASESLLVIRNSNNGTADTLAGAIYVTGPDSSNTTAEITVWGQ